MSVNKELFKLLMAIVRLQPKDDSYFVNTTVVSVEYNSGDGFTTLRVYYGGKHRFTATVKVYRYPKETSMETMLYFIQDKKGLAAWLRLKYLTFILGKMLNQVITEFYDGESVVGDDDLYVQRTINY